MAGYGVAGLARPLMPFATVWPLFLLLRVLDRIGKAVRAAPRDALLAASIAPDQRGLALWAASRAGQHRGRHRPAAGSGTAGAGVPLQQVFLWALVPGLACLLLSTALKESGAPPQPQAASSGAGAACRCRCALPGGGRGVHAGQLQQYVSPCAPRNWA